VRDEADAAVGADVERFLPKRGRHGREADDGAGVSVGIEEVDDAAFTELDEYTGGAVGGDGEDVGGRLLVRVPAPPGVVGAAIAQQQAGGPRRVVEVELHVAVVVVVVEEEGGGEQGHPLALLLRLRSLPGLRRLRRFWRRGHVWRLAVRHLVGGFGWGGIGTLEGGESV